MYIMLETVGLTPNFEIQRIITGLWQVSGTHGPINPMKAVEQMHAFHAKGFYTWDVADHYGPAEDFIGTFLEEIEEKHGAAERQKIQVLTKWVPTHPVKREVADVDYTMAYVEKKIDRSLKRMRVDALDVLQFHWWNYEDARLFDALAQLKVLHEKGKIKHLALTNFDGKHLELLLKEKFPVISNQVRYSLLDRRAEKDLVPVCEKYGVKLLAFGTLCGGLFHEKYIDRADPSLEVPFTQKTTYHKLVNNFGGWAMFQELLKTLNEIAMHKQVSISSVASLYILGGPGVAAVIIGARLGESNHIDETLEIDSLVLSTQDRQKITNALDRGRHLSDIMGEVASEYRHQVFKDMAPLK